MTQLPKLHYAGIDWATKTHAVGVVDQAGQIRARFQVPNTGKGLTGLIKRLGSLGWPAWRSNAPTVRWWKPCWRPTCAWWWSPRGRSRACPAGIGPAGPSPIPPTPCCWLMCCAPTATAWPRSPQTASRPRSCGRCRAPARTWSRPGSRWSTSSPASWKAAFPAPSGCSVSCTRQPPSRSWAAIPPATPPPPSPRPASLPSCAACTTAAARPSASCSAACRPPQQPGTGPAEAAGRAVWVLALLDAIQVTSRQERELEAEIIERLQLHADHHIFTSLPRAGHGVRRRRCWPSSATCGPASRPSKPWPPRVGPPRSPSPRATAGWSSSAGPATRSYGRRCSTSPMPPATPPLGGQDLCPGDPAHPPPPPRRAHPGPRLDPGDLAHLARRRRLRSDQAPRGGEAPGYLRLT